MKVTSGLQMSIFRGLQRHFRGLGAACLRPQLPKGARYLNDMMFAKPQIPPAPLQVSVEVCTWGFPTSSFPVLTSFKYCPKGGA